MVLGAARADVVPHGLTAWDWIHAGVILAGTVVLCVALRRIVGRVGSWRSEHAIGRLLDRVLTYVVVIVGCLYALGSLRIQIGPLLGALGIGGIALAFAMQDTLQNLVAGVILQARRPFRRGDQVQIDKYEGVVEDVDLRNVSLVTYDGLNVYLPNRTVLENPIVNYTRTPTRRVQISVGVAYGSDLAAVQRVLVDAVAATPGVEASPAPAAWVRQFGDSSVTVDVLFWFVVNRTSIWKARSDVAVSIQTALGEAGVEIPFPQRTVWLGERSDSVEAAGSNGGGHRVSTG